MTERHRHCAMCRDTLAVAVVSLPFGYGHEFAHGLSCMDPRCGAEYVLISTMVTPISAWAVRQGQHAAAPPTFSFKLIDPRFADA